MQISGNAEHSSSSSSSLVVNNIDLLNQILLCLPVKSLLVFKSVSKKWLSIISCPRFVQNHCIRNKLSKPGLLFPKPVITYDSVSLNERVVVNDFVTFETPDSEPLKVFIKQSCNGLLLCCDYYFGTGSSTYYIYNPSTKHYRILPPDPVYQILNYEVSLVFNPLKSLNYQVISICPVDDEPNTDTYQISIYSSVSSSWRLCRDTYYGPNIFIKGPGVFWDGCLNWINCDNNDTSLYFNIDREALETLPIKLPIGDKMNLTNKVYFGEWMGYMQLILSDQASPHCWVVFEMEIDYAGWKLKYRVRIDELANQYSFHHFNSCWVLLVVEGDGDGDELKALIHLTDNRIISYNLKKMNFKEICNYPKRQCQNDSRHAYIESLANV